MSNRFFALTFAWLAVCLGWFWRIAAERDLPVAPLGYLGTIVLAWWLWTRLDREDAQ